MATFRSQEDEDDDDGSDTMKFAGPYGSEPSYKNPKRKPKRKFDGYDYKNKRRKREEKPYVPKEETVEELFGEDRASPAYISYMLTKHILTSYRDQPKIMISSDQFRKDHRR